MFLSVFPVLTASVLPGEPVVGETFGVSYHTHQIRNKREDAEHKNLCSHRLCTSWRLWRTVRTNACFSHLFLHPCIGYLVHTWHRLRKSSLTVSIASWVLPFEESVCCTEKTSTGIDSTKTEMSRRNNRTQKAAKQIRDYLQCGAPDSTL